MKLTTAAALLTSIICLASCGSGSGGDPLASTSNNRFGGTLTSGGHLTNTFVNSDNRYAVSHLLFTQLFDSYTDGIRTAMAGSDVAHSFRVLGAFTGNAISDLFGTGSEQPQVQVIDDLKVVYNDFSNTGRLFLGGSLTYAGGWRTLNEELILDYLKVNGNIAFAGDYSGTFEFVDFLMAIDEQGNLFDAVELYDTPAAERPRVPIEGYVNIKSGTYNISLFNPFLQPDE